MRLILSTARPGREAQRGAALMLSLMVMIILILIVFQISMSSSTDARVSGNDLELTVFDGAIESAMLKTLQDLADDAAADEESAGTGGADPLGGGANPFGTGADGAGAAEATASDSRRDAWAKPQQTAINEVEVRVLIQDEDSKYNVLSMLTQDQDEAQKAFDRVVRILDMCREGTLNDIDNATAREMAEGMREFMSDRRNTVLPQPVQLTDVEEFPDRGMPMSLGEFVVLPAFNEYHFRDFRDSEGNAVHSIASFLTMWTSVKTYDEYIQEIKDAGGVGVTPSADPGASDAAPSPQTGNAGGGGLGGLNSGASGQGLGSAAAGANSGNGTPGIAVNINTAPSAVLHALFDRRDVPWDFLDEIVRYRNEEDEEATDPDADPVYDEFGDEVIQTQIFESVEELAEVDGWDFIDPDIRQDFERFLTVRSQVFTVMISARASTARESENGYSTTRQAERERRERGTDRTKTVRCVVWRYSDGEEIKMVLLEPWEVLSYLPIEVLDYPEDF